MTKGEQAGVKFAEWVQKHSLAAKIIFWSMMGAALVVFVDMIFDIAVRGKWISAFVIFAIAGWRAWQMAKAKAKKDIS